MKLRLALLFLASLFFLLTPSHIPIAFAAGQPAGPGRTITCVSNNGQRNYCSAFGARPGDVTLRRQIGSGACIQGQTWGVDQRGIWVDRGCRADFTIRTSANRPGPGGQTVTCSSNNGKRNYCNIPPRANVNLSRQISGSACVQGQTWGTDQRGLWVDKGCRAEFFVR
jgi:hypothetical protein